MSSSHLTSETSKEKNFPFWLVIALVLYTAGFAVATQWDLAINVTLFTPTNGFAIIMEAFGWYPAFLIAAFYGLLWFTKPPSQRSWWQALAGALVALGGLSFMMFNSLHHLVKRGWLTKYSDPRIFFWLAGGLLLALLLLLRAQKLPSHLRPSITFWAFWGSVYLVINQAVIYPFKIIWQRTRFDDMIALGSLDNFTPWFRPFGHGGSSFPSGHTANAAGLFILILLCDLFPAWRKRRRFVYTVIWVYIAAMAFSRVLIGRHYLSDTLAASGIMAVLFFLLRRTRFYRRGLAKLKDNGTS